jgi:hypothetical protein
MRRAHRLPPRTGSPGFGKLASALASCRQTFVAAAASLLAGAACDICISGVGAALLSSGIAAGVFARPGCAVSAPVLTFSQGQRTTGTRRACAVQGGRGGERGDEALRSKTGEQTSLESVTRNCTGAGPRAKLRLLAQICRATIFSSLRVMVRRCGAQSSSQCWARCLGWRRLGTVGSSVLVVGFAATEACVSRRLCRGGAHRTDCGRD